MKNITDDWVAARTAAFVDGASEHAIQMADIDAFKAGQACGLLPAFVGVYPRSVGVYVEGGTINVRDPGMSQGGARRYWGMSVVATDSGPAFSQETGHFVASSY